MAFRAEHLDAGENCIMRSFFVKCHQVEQLNDKMGRARGIHDETMNACRVLVGKSEGNRQLLWSGHRQGSLAQDLGQWKTLVKTAIKLQVP